MTKSTIILTGCGGVPTQNVLWSLRHEQTNLRIIGVDCDSHHIYRTKDFDRKYLIPRADDPRYIDTLNQVISKEKAVFVHPQPDVEVGVLSEKRKHIDAAMYLPDNDAVKLSHNKYDLLKALKKASIPCAETFLIRSEADLDEAFEALNAKVWIRLISGAGGRGSLPVENRDLAKHWIDYWKGWGKFSAEEYLPGRNLAWQGVFKDGELIGSIAWERIRYIIRHVSPSGITGTPSVAKLIDDDDVHEIGLSTIERITKTPTGVFGVDMRGNSKGIPSVTEINPGRFFTPSYMYANAGYNLVKTFFDMALGRNSTQTLPKRAQVPKNAFWIRAIDLEPTYIQLDKLPDPGEPIDI